MRGLSQRSSKKRMSMDAAFRFLEVIYGPFGADDSVSASEVLAAEARLGV